METSSQNQNQHEAIFRTLEAMTKQLAFVATGKQSCTLPTRKAELNHRLGWIVKQLDLSTLLQDSEFFLARMIDTHALGVEDPVIGTVQRYLEAVIKYYEERGISLILEESMKNLAADVPCYTTVSAHFDDVQGMTIDKMIDVAQMLCVPAILSRMNRVAKFSDLYQQIKQEQKNTFSIEKEKPRLQNLPGNVLEAGARTLLEVIDLLAFHIRLHTNTGPVVALMLQRVVLLHELAMEKKEIGEEVEEVDVSGRDLEIITAASFPCETDDDEVDEDTDEGTSLPCIDACSAPHSYYVKLKKNEQLRIQVNSLLPHMMVDMTCFLHQVVTRGRDATASEDSSDTPLIASTEKIVEVLTRIIAKRFDLRLFLTDSVTSDHVTRLPGWHCLQDGEAIPKEALVTVTDVKIDEQARVAVTVSHRDPKLSKDDTRGCGDRSSAGPSTLPPTDVLKSSGPSVKSPEDASVSTE